MIESYSPTSPKREKEGMVLILSEHERLESGWSGMVRIIGPDFRERLLKRRKRKPERKRASGGAGQALENIREIRDLRESTF